MKKKYSIIISFDGKVQALIQTDDNTTWVKGAVDGWGDDIMKGVTVQVINNKDHETEN